MIKHIVFFLALFIFSAYISHTIDAKSELVTPQEILTLKSQANTLLEDHQIQKKAHEQRIQRVKGPSKAREQQKLTQIEQAISEIKKQLQRLNEVIDMPLSRPEAEHIENQLATMKKKVHERHKQFHARIEK